MILKINEDEDKRYKDLERVFRELDNLKIDYEVEDDTDSHRIPFMTVDKVDIKQVIEDNESLTERYKIEDVKEFVNGLSDSDMNFIVSQMTDMIMESSDYWTALKEAIEYLIEERERAGN
jgi:hypothetical protein